MFRLNSFWGKFGQRPNLGSHKIVRSHTELLELYNNPDIEITGERFISDDAFFVMYKFKDDNIAPEGCTNVAVAAMVTSEARIHLYRVMKWLEDTNPGCLMYCDTDSVLFTWKPGQQLPPWCGNLLGDLSDELPNHKCTEANFVAPKCYSLKLESSEGEDYICKIKGLTLNADALKVINHNVMSKLSSEFLSDTTVRRETCVPQSVFKIDKSNIFTRHFDKIFKITSNKRRITLNVNDTLPFGYVDDQ